MNKFIFTSIFTFFFCANVGQDFNRPHVFPAIPEAINIGTVVPVSINADPMRYTPGTGNVYSRFQTSKSAALASIVNTDPMRYTPGTGKVYECFMNKNRTKEVASVGNICAEVVSVPCSCVDGVAKPEVTEVTAVVVQDSNGHVVSTKLLKDDINVILMNESPVKHHLKPNTDQAALATAYRRLLMKYDKESAKGALKYWQNEIGFDSEALENAFESVERRL